MARFFPASFLLTNPDTGTTETYLRSHDVSRTKDDLLRSLEDYQRWNRTVCEENDKLRAELSLIKNTPDIKKESQEIY